MLGIAHIATPVYATDANYTHDPNRYISYGQALTKDGSHRNGVDFNIGENFNSDGNSTHWPVFVVWSTGGSHDIAPGLGGKINLSLTGNIAGTAADRDLSKGLDIVATNQWGQTKM